MKNCHPPSCHWQFPVRPPIILVHVHTTVTIPCATCSYLRTQMNCLVYFDIVRPKNSVHFFLYPYIWGTNSPPCPWDTHYQFSIKTLLSKVFDAARHKSAIVSTWRKKYSKRYIYVYILVHECICIYICIYIYIYVRIDICIYIYMYICIQTNLYICICTCVYLYMYAYMDIKTRFFSDIWGSLPQRLGAKMPRSVIFFWTFSLWLA